MKHFRNSVLAGAVALVLAPAASAEVSVNVSAVSNYLWRGVTQTDDGPAVQGGIDYGHESGFYLGTWISNVDFGDGEANYEWDIYGGYDFDVAEDFAFGINTIYYAYPDGDSDIDFWEIGLSGGYKLFSAGLQYTVWGDDDNDDGPFDNGDIYFYGGLDFELPQEFGLGLVLGRYNFDNADDYTHWSVSLSKDIGDLGSLSFSYEQNNGSKDDDVATDDDPKLWVGWSKEF
jgi:uncharacterized protein (TIGR02001 family)